MNPYATMSDSEYIEQSARDLEEVIDDKEKLLEVLVNAVERAYANENSLERYYRYNRSEELGGAVTALDAQKLEDALAKRGLLYVETVGGERVTKGYCIDQVKLMLKDKK